MAEAKLSAAQRLEVIELQGKETAPSLAARFGITDGRVRNIWFDHRRSLGLSPAPKTESSQNAFRRKYSSLGFERVGESIEPVYTAEMLDDPLTDKGITLMQLESHHCRWIIGKDADDQLRYCGCQIAKNVARAAPMYCVGHAMTATKPAYRQSAPVPSPNRKAAPFDVPETEDSRIEGMPFFDTVAGANRLAAGLPAR